MPKLIQIKTCDEYCEILKEIDPEGSKFPGIKDKPNRKALVDEIIDSARRVNIVRKIPKKRKNCKVDSDFWNPKNDKFNPKFGAVELKKDGQFDEAVWLIFLHIHFGEDCGCGSSCSPIQKSCLNLLKEFYSKFGSNSRLTFKEFKKYDLKKFLSIPGMTKQNLNSLGSYSNHRQREKYEPEYIYRILSEYRDKFLSSHGNFSDLIKSISPKTKKYPEWYFKYLFSLLFPRPKRIFRFGRLAVFDFLATLGNLDILPLEPDSTHLLEATGPLKGANALINNDKNIKNSKNDYILYIEQIVDNLDDSLKIGKHALEDCLCNWQKKFPHCKLAQK